MLITHYSLLITHYSLLIMKRKMTTLLALAVSLSAAAQQQTYNISGTAVGHDGMKVMLVAEDKSPIDSTIVADGKFQLTGPLAVQMAMLKMGGTSEAIILHEKPIQMTFQRVKSERRGKAIEVPEIKVFSGKRKRQAILSKLPAFYGGQGGIRTHVRFHSN